MLCYYITLYYIILYCIVFHYIILYYMMHIASGPEAFMDGDV